MVLTTRVVTKDFDRLEPDWQRLFERSPQAAPPLRFQWLGLWWKHYAATCAAGPDAQRIVTFYDGPQLVGALPLYLCHPTWPLLGLKRLAFLSTCEPEAHETMPDYLDFLTLPEYTQDCLDALPAALNRIRFDLLDLRSLPATSPLLQESLQTTATRLIPSGPCPIAEIAGGLEPFFLRFSHRSRGNLRRWHRDAAKHHATFELATPATLDAFYADLIRLHQTRWTACGKPGTFASPLFTAFHRDLLGALLPAGHAVLARMAIAGEPIALIYGFITRTKFDFYQSGMRFDSPLNSPGITAHLLLIERLSQQGITHYDFLAGSNPYKDRMSTTSQSMFTLQFRRPTMRMAAHGLHEAIHTRAASLRRRLFHRSPVGPATASSHPAAATLAAGVTSDIQEGKPHELSEGT